MSSLFLRAQKLNLKQQTSRHGWMCSQGVVQVAQREPLHGTAAAALGAPGLSQQHC
jgi:hypothetical protein